MPIKELSTFISNTRFLKDLLRKTPRGELHIQPLGQEEKKAVWDVLRSLGEPIVYLHTDRVLPPKDSRAFECRFHSFWEGRKVPIRMILIGPQEVATHIPEATLGGNPGSEYIQFTTDSDFSHVNVWIGYHGVVKGVQYVTAAGSALGGWGNRHFEVTRSGNVKQDTLEPSSCRIPNLSIALVGCNFKAARGAMEALNVYFKK